MKKAIFSFMLFCWASVMSVYADKLSFGFTAGMNIAKTEGEGAIAGWGQDSKTGWYAGVMLRFSVPVAGVGFDIGATYLRESVPFSDSMPQGVEYDTRNMNYIAVPLHIRYDLALPGVSNFFIPYVFTGPQACFALNSDTFKGGDWTWSTSDLVWRWDLGAGVILVKHLQLSYNYGFALNSSSEFTYSNLQEDFKTGVHRVGLTLFF